MAEPSEGLCKPVIPGATCLTAAPGKPGKRAPLLAKPASCPSGAGCLFLGSLPALRVWGLVSNFIWVNRSHESSQPGPNQAWRLRRLLREGTCLVHKGTSRWGTGWLRAGVLRPWAGVPGPCLAHSVNNKKASVSGAGKMGAL